MSIEEDFEILNFPKGWAKLKDQPLPAPPKDLWAFLNSFSVSQEELERKRPVKGKFTIPNELKHLK